MINNFFKNNLIKIGVFNSTSIVVKIIASIVSSKALALFIGPSGLGLLGIFKEFFNMTMNVSSLGLQRGIIKYSAELKNHKEELKIFISTTMVLGLVVSIIISFFVFIFSVELNNFLFFKNNYIIIFKTVAFLIPISVLSNYWIFILNGLGYLKQVIRINILLYILNMMAIVVLSYKFTTTGALLGISIVYILQLLSIIVFKPKGFAFKISCSTIFSSQYFKKIIGYTLMTITSLLLFPFISILIREEIINLIGESAAGFWEAMKRISENYLLFASSLILLSVLPKLSENQSDENFRKVIWDYIKSIIPFFIIGLVVVYLFKDLIVRLLYSQDFLPMNILFKWYLLGDLFRVLGMLLAANFFARRNILGYIFTDIFLAVVMYVSTIALLKHYGLNGGGMAYLLSYLMYFILLLLVFGKKLFSVKQLK
jgi:PST family polysaccharide transporter